MDIFAIDVDAGLGFLEILKIQVENILSNIILNYLHSIDYSCIFLCFMIMPFA